MKTDELTAVGSIFSLIVLSIYMIVSNYITDKHTSILYKELNTAQRAVVALDTRIDNLSYKHELLKDDYNRLNRDMDYLLSLQQIKEDLRGYSIKDQAIGLALSWTESSWRYNVTHYGDVAKGICGVVPELWKPFLDSKGVPVNSIGACIEIYKVFLQETGSPYAAIKAYKGIQNPKNIYLISKTLVLRDKIFAYLSKDS